MSPAINITNNKAQDRFETDINGEYAYLEYKLHHDRILLIHTFTPESARGKGISSSLAKFALDYAIENNLKVLVYCPFVTAYLKTHPEYENKLHITYKH